MIPPPTIFANGESTQQQHGPSILWIDSQLRRAILPVHMNGMAAPMNELIQAAEQHPHPKHGPPKVIGDAARACGGGYCGAKIGKHGWMNVFSFHTMKLMTTLGEGGMITTDDPDLAQRLRAIRQWGGTTDDWGSSYKTTKVQAAVGRVQLKRLDDMIALRVRRARERLQMLAGIPELIMPYEPADCEHTFYLFTLLVPESWAGAKRDRIRDILLSDYRVGTMVGNAPAWTASPFIDQATRDQQHGIPVSLKTAQRLFCVSLHPLMTEEQNAYICAALWETVERVRQEQ